MSARARIGVVMESTGHSSATFQEPSSLLLLLIMMVFQAALPKMVIASGSREPHQLPQTFIPANKTVNSIPRKPLAKEAELINRHFKCGEPVPTLLGVLPPTSSLHLATLYTTLPQHATSQAQKGPGRRVGRVTLEMCH